MENRFLEVVEGRHGYAREWKARTGGKVLGYFCTWVPEELFYASGFLPVRIMGSHEPSDIVDPHIQGLWCSFCRDCAAQGLLGRYDYLDGIAMPQACYHMRHAFEVWRGHVGVANSFYFFAPTEVHTASAKAMMPGVYHGLRSDLERVTGSAISDSSLCGAIDLYDANRRLLRQLYELRKADSPKISGLEAMRVALSAMLMDKREHNALLNQLLEELPDRPARQRPRSRLILIGSETDHAELFELIESLGADVVIEDNCVGSRYFWNLAPEDGDPVDRLARRYLEKPPCPLYDKGQERRRLPFIRSLVKEWNVEGAILVQLKFCDPHGYDMPVIRDMLKELGIPPVVIETDVTVSVGPLRTRIEAHLEALELDLV